ncbi:ATP-binding protein [Microbacterium sp. 22195]|uniref:ATP-binding protein n=1 Tax=Microbacterium sp. 22195 TaxID=3453891 RepID=UPI003F85B5D3
MRATVRPLAPEPLFLGRDTELADLVTTGRAGLTSGRFLLVRGEGGIGKSTLIDAAIAQAPPERHVLRGAADAMDRRLTYGLLLDALGPVLTDEDRRIATEQNEHIAGERLLSVIDAATRESTVLILEDLHWADTASLRLLARLARTLQQLPLVVVGSMRPQARHDVAPALDHLLDELLERGLLHTFDLGPLPESACVAIAEHLAGAPVGESLAHYAAAAGGNPLFLTEMVRSLLRDGAVTVGPDGAELRSTPVGPSPSLATVMMRHLSRLSIETRELLSTAALLGARFPAAQLRLVADRPMSDLLPLLREALAAGFLTEIDEDAIGFRHQLIQEVLLHDLPHSVRAELHRDVALKLDAAGVPAATVAEHLLRAPTARDDLAWMLRLAERTTASAPGIAAELWERVLAHSDDADPMHVIATAGVARVALSAGQAREAGELAEDALDKAGGVDPGEVGTMLRAIETRSLLMQHRHAEAHERAIRYAASEVLEPAERAAQLAFAGWPLFMLGDSDGALQLARDGAALAAAEGNHGAEVYALALHGQIATCRGDLDEAVRVLADAVAIADRHSSLSAIEAFPHAQLAVALADVDRTSEAAALVQQGLRVSERFGYRTGILATHTLAAQARSHSGDLADIAAELEAHRAMLGSMEIRLDPPVRGLRAQVIAEQSGPEAALEAAAQLDPIPGRQLWGGRGRSWIWLGHAQIPRARGDAEAALRVLQRGWEELHSAGLLMDCAEIALELVVLARQVRRDGVPDAAERGAVTGEEVSAAITALAVRNPGVVHLQATALAVAGVVSDDAESLVEAERLMAATPRRLDRARIAELAARAVRPADPRARALAETALRAYTEVGADHEAARARASFRHAGVPVALPARSRPASGWESLTRTEERIAGHVATGQTNLEIAQSLFISRRTVETHVSNILAKLGLRSRTELAIRFAHRLDQPGQ